MKHYFYKAIFVLIIFAGCTTNNLNQKKIDYIATSQRKILYFERPPDPNGSTLVSGAWELIMYDLETNEKIPLQKSILADFTALSPSGKLIAYSLNYEQVPSIFVIYDYAMKQEHRVGKLLPKSELSIDGVSNLAFLNDTTLVFTIDKKIYSLAYTNDSVKLLKTLPKQINEISVRPSGNVIALAIGDMRFNNQLVFFNIDSDSVYFTDLQLMRFYKWDLSGNRIAYRDTIMKILNFTNGFVERVDSLNVPDSTKRGGWFIDDRTILMIIYDNYFVYDLIDKKIVKQITSEGYAKGYIGSYVRK